MVETARRHGAGVFVLALTSNKEGPEVQHATVDHPRGAGTVAGTVLDHLRRLNEGLAPLGDLGAVIGATIGETAEDLDFNGPVLAPGFGAQGGTVADLERIFGKGARYALPSSSRGVLQAGPDPSALRDAALRGIEAVSELGA
jgi:orotidine-5'-phosphate decarboxylase